MDPLSEGGGKGMEWNTPLNIFDSTKEKDPNLIYPGDIITFKAITKDQYHNHNE